MHNFYPLYNAIQAPLVLRDSHNSNSTNVLQIKAVIRHARPPPSQMGFTLTKGVTKKRFKGRGRGEGCASMKSKYNNTKRSINTTTYNQQTMHNHQLPCTTLYLALQCITLYHVVCCTIMHYLVLHYHLVAP